MLKIGKMAVTSPFRWPFRVIRESEASGATSQTQAVNDRAALGILSRALLEAAAALDIAAGHFRNGQATPMMSQRAHFAAKAARDVLEDLGITRRAPATRSGAKV